MKSIGIADEGQSPVSERTTLRRLAVASPSDAQVNTPLLPARPMLATDVHGTLTFLSGEQEGRMIAVDRGGVVIGRALGCEVVVEDPGVSRRHARVSVSGDGGFHVTDLASRNGTFINARRASLGELRPGDLLQLGPDLRMRFSLAGADDEMIQRRLYESSVRDTLTHAFNRRYFADRLGVEIARARRSAGALDVLMVDVDHFKPLNDRFGHLAGDRALCVVVAQMARLVRTEDVVARFGGDEFVILAVSAHQSDASHLAERVRSTIARLPFQAGGTPASITVSVGLASLSEIEPSDQPSAAILELADHRLYEAKEHGRNRVCTNG